MSDRDRHIGRHRDRDRYDRYDSSSRADDYDLDAVTRSRLMEEWAYEEVPHLERPVRRSRPARECRSRLLAFIVLAVMAAILVFVGVIGGPATESGTAGEGGVPFQIVPVTPANLGADTEGSAMTATVGAASSAAGTSTDSQ